MGYRVTTTILTIVQLYFLTHGLRGAINMSANSRKRDRRKNKCPIDWQAEQEGKAIERRWELGVVHVPRIRKTYVVDGIRYNTGNTHRDGGAYGFPHANKIRHTHATKQRNLQHENICKRLENPTLYKYIDIRRAQHDMEYRSGLVKPGD